MSLAFWNSYPYMTGPRTRRGAGAAADTADGDRGQHLSNGTRRRRLNMFQRMWTKINIKLYGSGLNGRRNAPLERRVNVYVLRLSLFIISNQHP